MTVNSIETTCSSPIAIAECRDMTSPSVNYTCDNYTFDYMCMCRKLIDSGIQSHNFNGMDKYTFSIPLYPPYSYCDEMDMIANAYFGLSLSSAYLAVYPNTVGDMVMKVVEPYWGIDETDTDGYVWCEMRHNIEIPQKYND